MKQLEIQILGKTQVTFEYWGTKFFRLTTSLNVSGDIIIVGVWLRFFLFFSSQN